MLIQKSQPVRQQLKVGDYILILTQPPEHHYIKPCTLGRVTRIPPWYESRQYSVDVFDPHEGEVMGIGLPAENLRRIAEGVLQSGRLPKPMDRGLLDQYVILKEVRSGV